MIDRRSAWPACALVLILASAAGAQVRNWPTEGPPRPLPARDITFPPYELKTLPNGLQVVAVLHHDQPVVSMRLLFRAGSAADPKGKLGLAHLFASVLDQGTLGPPAKSAEELADEIDFLGGSMGAGAGTDLTHLNMLVMKDSFETGMRMLSEMARKPAFSVNEIERQRQQMLSGLQVSQQDPEYIANAVFDRLVYGFHPYGLPDAGTADSLLGITRDDLVAFHKRHFAPNNGILAIVGDVTAEEAFATATKVFGDWERRDVPVETYVETPDPTRRVIVVNKPDAVQTEVRVGHIGVQRNHPDYLAINLAIRILGGEGSNRLHQILRTERGLTYGAQANMDALKVTGDFEAETNTRSNATGEVLRLIVDEFVRLQRDPVGERELADAKAYMTGSFPLTIETPQAIALQVVNVLFYGLPLNDLQTFRNRVNAVTPDDIQRVAQKYLRPDRLSVVLVGNASAFTSQLRGAGFATYETVDLTELDLMTANFKRAGAAGRVGKAGGAGGAGKAGVVQALRPAAAAYTQAPAGSRPVQPATSEEIARASALVDRAIDATGGLEALRRLRTIIVKQTIVNHSAAGDVLIATTSFIEYPDRFRTETTIPGGVNVQAFDGTRVWSRDRQGIHDLPDAVVRDARATMRRDPVALLIAAKAGALKSRVLPDTTVGDQTHHTIELSAPDFGPVVLSIDGNAGTIVKQRFASEAPGRPIVEEEFSDYRAVGGVQVAFQVSRKNGTQKLERLIDEIIINPPIDSALFKRPS